MADQTLDEFRESIDNIDAALVFLLAERFKVTQKVGYYKRKTDFRRLISLEKLNKSNDCDGWHAMQTWIRSFQKNFFILSSTK